MTANSLQFFTDGSGPRAPSDAHRPQPYSPWRDILARAARAARARTAALFVHDLGNPRGSIHTSINIPPPLARSYSEHYGALNPWLEAADRFQASGTVFTGDDLIAEDDIVASRFYAEWLAPQEVLPHLFGVVLSEGDLVVFIALARRRGEAPFDERDAALLQAALPGASATYRLERQVVWTRSRLAAAWSALDRLTIGVLVADGGGRVLGANTVARDIVGLQNGLVARNGQVSCSQARDAVRLRGLLEQIAMNGGPQETSHAMTINRDEGLPPLHAILVPLEHPGRAGTQPRHAVGIYLWEPDRTVCPKEEWLHELYGLSRVDAEIAALLCNGLMPEEVAQRRRASIHTIRAHLKRIFLKTGVSRQAALVRLLLFGPALVRDGSRNGRQGE